MEFEIHQKVIQVDRVYFLQSAHSNEKKKQQKTSWTVATKNAHLFILAERILRTSKEEEEKK